MDTTPSFLTHFGLDTETDERAIRRAYARRVKQIDQESDPAAFQDLRQAYEAALAWAASRADATSGSAQLETSGLAPATPAAQHAPSEPVAPQLAQTVDPRRLAHAVLDEFEAAIPRLPGSEGYWQRELKRCLGDPRLLNIGARIEFEVLIANRLAQGWKSGNQLLLGAAVSLFGWASDRERLRSLGAPGYLLDRAIDENAAFAALPMALQTELQRTIAMLQTSVPLDDELARRQRSRIQQLVGRFPAFVRVVANPDCAGNWRELAKKLPLWKRLLRDRDGEPLGMQELAGRALFILALCSIPFLSSLPRRHTAEPPPPWANRLTLPAQPAAGPSWAWRKPDRPPAPPMRPITRAEQDEILGRVVYKPDPHGTPDRSSVVYDVVIDAQGQPFGVNRVEWSGDPAFHAAVKQAILESKLFPQDVQRMFRVGFAVELQRQKAPTLPAGQASGASE